MRISTPAFGMISGVATSLGFLPHVFFLLTLFFLKIPSKSIAFLVVFSIAAKLLGEWIFLRLSQKRMDSEPKLKNWRLVVNKSLLSHQNVIFGLIMMLQDVFIDTVLINFALKTSVQPIWIFLSLLGCQALASPIQGGLSDIFSQKKSLLFANLMGMIAISALSGILLGGQSDKASIYSVTSLLGISSFSINVQMFIILCGKGLLGNITVIARAAITEVIKVQTLEKCKSA